MNQGAPDRNQDKNQEGRVKNMLYHPHGLWRDVDKTCEGEDQGGTKYQPVGALVGACSKQGPGTSMQGWGRVSYPADMHIDWLSFEKTCASPCFKKADHNTGSRGVGGECL